MASGKLSFLQLSKEIDKKADKVSPVFTGVPKAPTPTIDTANDQIANTEFVQQVVTLNTSSKADKSQLSNYVQKTDTIEEHQLSASIVQKLNDTSSGSGDPIVVEYDDTELVSSIDSLKTDVSNLKSSKVDTTTLTNYRLKSTKIAEADLTTELAAKVNSSGSIYDDTAIKGKVTTLEGKVSSLETELPNKATKTELQGYRAKNTEIIESDLSQSLRDKVNAVTGGTGYDDTAIQGKVTNLEKSVGDINTALGSKVDDADLADYRLKSAKIAEADLTTEVVTKLNQSGSTYDDTAIQGKVATIETDLIEMQESLDDYRPKADKIVESDLSTELAAKVNAGSSTGYDDTAIQGKVTTLEGNLSTLEGTVSTLETDVSGIETSLGNYRPKADKIAEADLTTELAAKVNASGSIYDDTAIKGKVTTLEGKVSTLETDIDGIETSLTNYRPKSIKIDEVDLSTAVVTKLNASGSTYDDTAIKGKVTTLEGKVSSLETELPNKATKTELGNYRLKTVKIAEADLDTAVATKLNKTVITSHGGLTNLNGDTNYLHITKAEKDKYEGYASQIESLLQTVATLTQQVEDLKNDGGTGGEPPVDPEEPTEGIAWTHDFRMPGGTANWHLTKDTNWTSSGKTLSLTDVYGEAFDGNGSTELLFMGYQAQPTEPGQIIPLSGFGTEPAPSTQGGWSYDDSTGVISFDSGETVDSWIRIVKYV